MAINPVQFSKFELTYSKVLVRLGFASGKTNIDSKIKDILDEEIDAATKLFAPKQVTASSVIRLTGGKVTLEPSYMIESSDILSLFKGCSEAFGFAVTIGHALEARRDKYLIDKETTRALVLDAAGSVAAEELAEITNGRIKEEASKKGLAATRRFSPGYGDWGLAGQKDFLAWLGADQIGIKLTGTFEMIPEKSVSAILGLKSAEPRTRKNDGQNSI